MNFFLLTAVPLAAVAAHRLLAPTRPAFADPKAWIVGAVWAITSLVAASFFGRWREFTGDLGGAFGGLAFTDVLLVPGLVVAAWVLTRRRADAWELSLWLALTFTMAGIRDFAATSRIDDLNELFLVPLDRILLVLLLPTLIVNAREIRAVLPRVVWILAAAGLLLTGTLVPVLSFAGWGWVVWVAEGAALAALVVPVLWQKKAASEESGSPT